MTTTLHIYYSETTMTLPEAIAAFHHGFEASTNEATALLYAPYRCCFARLNADGLLRTMTQEAECDANLDTVFEARLFNRQAELRWLHTESGQGKAALLCETGDHSVFGPKGHVAYDMSETPLPQRYLLWGLGMGANCEKPWSQLSSARIGAYMVPLAGIEAQQRVQLTAVEYLYEYKHGNVGVMDERLTGLRAAEEGGHHG